MTTITKKGATHPRSFENTSAMVLLLCAPAPAAPAHSALLHGNLIAPDLVSNPEHTQRTVPTVHCPQWAATGPHCPLSGGRGGYTVWTVLTVSIRGDRTGHRPPHGGTAPSLSRFPPGPFYSDFTVGTVDSACRLDKGDWRLSTCDASDGHNHGAVWRSHTHVPRTTCSPRIRYPLIR